jgi:sigma-B regulation protein RsbQ
VYCPVRAGRKACQTWVLKENQGVQPGADEMADIIHRHHVVQRGQGQRPMVFSHGFGCDQQMWRFVAPAFEADHRVIVFDHIGCGRADITAYDDVRHAQIEGCAEDVNALLEALDLRDVIFVGHSVSAMIGVLAAIAKPERFSQLALVCPSPRYLNDPPAYTGGFSRADIDGLFDLMESSPQGWASFLAPVVMGGESPPELTDELKASFCASDPYITRRFAQAVFLSDHRHVLQQCTVPSLILQSGTDAIAPPTVGQFMHAHLPQSTLVVTDTVGHCPHLTDPALTIETLRRYLGG